MNRCKECKYLREARPLSHALARELGSDEEVITELSRIMKDERQKQDAEAKLKNMLLLNERMNWPTRPAMTSYCGVSEDEDIFLVWELKNPNQDCGDYKPASGYVLCKDCKH